MIQMSQLDLSISQSLTLSLVLQGLTIVFALSLKRDFGLLNSVETIKNYGDFKLDRVNQHYEMFMNLKVLKAKWLQCLNTCFECLWNLREVRPSCRKQIAIRVRLEGYNPSPTPEWNCLAFTGALQLKQFMETVSHLPAVFLSHAPPRMEWAVKSTNRKYFNANFGLTALNSVKHRMQATQV